MTPDDVSEFSVLTVDVRCTYLEFLWHNSRFSFFDLCKILHYDKHIKFYVVFLLWRKKKVFVYSYD